MSTLYKVGTSNAISTTISSSLTSSETSAVTLADTTGLQAPGIIVIDRVDPNSLEETPTLREYIGFTSIVGFNLTGLMRGLGDSTAQQHNAGAIVEEVMTVDHWNDLRDIFITEHNEDGTHSDITADSITIDTISTDSVTAKTTNGDLTLSGNGTGAVKVDSFYGDLDSNSDGATVTFNLASSNKHTVTLAGNRTLALSNAKVGQVFILRLVQDATGSRTVTWFSTIKWAGGSSPILTTTANKADVLGFLCTSSGNYDGFVIGQNL